MRPEQLMTGESILQYSDSGLITLTTHRIRYRNKIWGQSNFISIMLKKVSSLQVVGISYPVLLIIGILVGLIGLLVSYNQQGRNEEGIIAVIIGVLFVIAYFFTKRHECVIVSDGGSRIAFRTEGMNTETLIDMMDKIELAKTTRVSHLKTL